MYGLEYRLRLAARRAAMSTVAGLFLLIGILLLAAAAFIWLANTYGAVFAAVVGGIAMLALGLILLAINGLSRRMVVAPSVAPTAALPASSPTAAVVGPVMAALAMGIANGVLARRTARRRRTTVRQDID